MTNKQPICFVFNSRVLVPWFVVKDHLDQDDVVLLRKASEWQTSRSRDFHFTDNQEVCDVNNIRQKMTVRRFIREEVKVGNEFKSRLKGIECYWWVEVTLKELFRQLNVLSERRSVPDVYEAEEHPQETEEHVEISRQDG